MVSEDFNQISQLQSKTCISINGSAALAKASWLCIQYFKMGNAATFLLCILSSSCCLFFSLIEWAIVRCMRCLRVEKWVSKGVSFVFLVITEVCFAQRLNEIRVQLNKTAQELLWIKWNYSKNNKLTTPSILKQTKHKTKEKEKIKIKQQQQQKKQQHKKPFSKTRLKVIREVYEDEKSDEFRWDGDP